MRGIRSDRGESLDRRVDLLSHADLSAFSRGIVERLQRRVGVEPGVPFFRCFSVYCDYATSARVGAAGMFQVISLTEGDADMTHLVHQGAHYYNLDELRKDVAKALRIDPEDIEVEEVEEV
jgi:hypothetical protein